MITETEKDAIIVASFGTSQQASTSKICTTLSLLPLASLELEHFNLLVEF